ncbi:GIDE domain-containing protein [Halobium salinum]|uniref:RING-type E3 ubiquitin transferase n=1 Tax=Halobium salinum TaxID=1364940 RepID=A0ABD5PGL7_9EURY|nr:GIDE domain-containing protein [Halobium salinum]
MDTELVLGGLGGCLFGLLLLWDGLSRRRQHRLVTRTETTEIRQLTETGRVEIEGEVVGPADGSETFTSPVGERPGTVLAGWAVEEWSERGKRQRWTTLASGVYSRPFVVDDGTGRVRVALDDRVVGGESVLSTLRSVASDGTASGRGVAVDGGVTVDGVVCEFEFLPTVEVGAGSTPPDHIRRFVAGERRLSEGTDSLTNLVDLGHAHGDRRYHEGTLAVGDDVYVLGHATADAKATTPLRAEDVVVTAVDDEPFVVSDRPEAALADRLEDYEGRLFVGAVVLLLGLGSVATGATDLL